MTGKTGFKLGDSQKKALAIVVPTVIVVLALIVSTILFFTNKTEQGQAIQDKASTQFSAIEVPKDSSELTHVQDAPVNRPDKSGDKNDGVDLLGNKVKPQDPPTTEKRKDKRGQQRTQAPRRPSAEEMKQISNTGKRVKIPAVGADFALGQLREPSSGIIEPTNYTSVFWITNRGVKYDNTKSGTAYLAAHALDVSEDGSGLSGLAPGNWLYDPVSHQSKLQPGDILEVGGVKFKFTSSKRAGKGLISRDKDIWNEKKKNRLVWITCMSRSNDNFVLFFEKV